MATASERRAPRPLGSAGRSAAWSWAGGALLLLVLVLVLVGFTFWLPMLPGLWLARREMAASPSPPGEPDPGAPARGERGTP